MKSPCINACQLDLDWGLCTGCYRTANEVMDWPYYSDAQKVDISKTLETRKRVYKE